jgi:hypothetical protein
VETPDGPLPIELLEVGDAVLSASLDESGYLSEDILVTATVLKTYKSIECEYLLINGLIQVTESHPFYVNGEWKFAGDLTVGDELIGADGVPVIIEMIDTLDRGVRVYNIEVDKTHTFIADGILVHNKPPNPQG